MVHRIGQFGRCAAMLLLVPLSLGSVQKVAAQTTTITSNAAGITSIKIDGTVYHSASEALEALRLNLSTQVAAVPVERQPIVGRARIVLADRNRLRPLITQNSKQNQTAQVIDYTIDSQRVFQRAMADTLVKVHVFQSATIVEQNDTRDPDIGDADFLVWYQVLT